VLGVGGQLDDDAVSALDASHRPGLGMIVHLEPPPRTLTTEPEATVNTAERKRHL
jgi:hypothetical protein